MQERERGERQTSKIIPPCVFGPLSFVTVTACLLAKKVLHFLSGPLSVSTVVVDGN